MINLVTSARVSILLFLFSSILIPFRVLSAIEGRFERIRKNQYICSDGKRAVKRAAQNGFEIKLRRAIIKCWNALLITHLFPSLLLAFDVSG